MGSLKNPQLACGFLKDISRWRWGAMIGCNVVRCNAGWVASSHIISVAMSANFKSTNKTKCKDLSSFMGWRKIRKSNVLILRRGRVENLHAFFFGGGVEMRGINLSVKELRQIEIKYRVRIFQFVIIDNEDVYFITLVMKKKKKEKWNKIEKGKSIRWMEEKRKNYHV